MTTTRPNTDVRTSAFPAVIRATACMLVIYALIIAVLI
jgi:hypothetical protein